MIPCLIHCFWFSGEKKPPLVERCLASWRKFAPEFEIREWNVSMLRTEFGALPRFAEDALNAHKWAFASNWARFAVVERFGGVYLDLDVELVKPIGGLVSEGAFFALSDDSGWVDPGLGFAAERGNSVCREIAAHYETATFDPGCHLSQTAPEIVNGILRRLRSGGAALPRMLPAGFFNPKGTVHGRVEISSDTYAIHHFAASWFSWKQKLAYRLLPAIGVNIHPLVSFWRRLTGKKVES